MRPKLLSTAESVSEYVRVFEQKFFLVCFPALLDSNELLEQLTYDQQGESGHVRVSMSSEVYAVAIVVTAQDGVTQSEYIVELRRYTVGISFLDTSEVRWWAVLCLFAACFGKYKSE